MIMQGKKGLIMGVANDRSIAWGIAKILAENGALVAFTYQGEALKKRVEPLANSINSDILVPCDVSDSNSIAEIVCNPGASCEKSFPEKLYLPSLLVTAEPIISPSR